MKHRSEIKRFAIIIAILILLLAVLYSGLRILESTVLLKGNGEEPGYESKTIYRDGVAYYPRQDITVIMLTGVDTQGPMVSSGSYNNLAEADMVSLLIFDETAKAMDILTLNRDSMVEFTLLGIGGKPAGTRIGQLALAHTYGSGMEDSSCNLRSAVSDLLYGLYIDQYVTINMDAIAKLNDAVGGVTVDVTEDFSKVDPSIPMGKVTLKGQQSTSYVRLRYDVDDQLNLSRMERHRKYMTGFMAALREKSKSDPYFLLSAYEEVDEYMVTDCSTSVMTGLLDRFGDYELRDVLTLEGENRKGTRYMEYHLDEEALDKFIVEYLYDPK